MAYYQSIFPEGTVRLNLPDRLSEQSLRDLEDWLNLALRRYWRRVERENEFIPEIPWAVDPFPGIPWSFPASKSK